ncbi:MAG: hypothetical protein IJ642_08515, partial [Oscillospiraceae bacterium]|nr:hypothetical protein [Oscillospiraceae bacterium]
MEKTELAKINALTRRDLTEDEIYAFPVTLCHNDIDRDGERFSDEAFNCSEDDKKMFENLTRYIGETYNQSPGTIQVWCWRIAIETCNAL